MYRFSDVRSFYLQTNVEHVIAFQYDSKTDFKPFDLKLTNVTNAGQYFKIKVSDNNLFDIEEVVGYLELDEERTIRITFNPKATPKPREDPKKPHFLSIFHMDFPLTETVSKGVKLDSVGKTEVEKLSLDNKMKSPKELIEARTPQLKIKGRFIDKKFEELFNNWAARRCYLFSLDNTESQPPPALLHPPKKVDGVTEKLNAKYGPYAEDVLKLRNFILKAYKDEKMEKHLPAEERDAYIVWRASKFTVLEPEKKESFFRSICWWKKREKEEKKEKESQKKDSDLKSKTSV